MRYEKLFNFSHEYQKLNEDRFTTIRSIKKPFKVGDEGWIFIKGEKRFLAKIRRIEDQRIDMIPLDLLKKDVAPFEISSHEMFIDFLNELLLKYGAPFKSYKLSSKMRIFFLEKIEE